MKKPQLFLIHFAGGNYYSYQFIIPLLQEFDVIPLELPGRGRRAGERLLKDFDAAARDIHSQVTRKLKQDRFLIYGHSMGAYLALRVANLLETQGRFPEYLVVSGNAGPGIPKDTACHHLPQREFFTELSLLGGIPAALMENEELYRFFEPILRADMEIAEKADLAGEPAIHAPLFAIMGNRERKVDKIGNWAHYTRSEFNYEILEGDHFFIHKHPARIAGILSDCLALSS